MFLSRFLLQTREACKSITVSAKCLASRSGSQAPVKPLSPYCRYIKENSGRMKKENTQFSITDVVTNLAKQWRELPVETKAIYEQQYDVEISNFRALEEKWWSQLTPEQKEQNRLDKLEKKRKRTRRKIKQKLLALGMPKKPQNAWAYFVQAKISAYGQMSSDTSGHSVIARHPLKDLGDRWKSLSDEHRKEFITLAEEDSRRYKNEMPFWKLKLMQQGNGHLLRLLNKRPESLKTRDLKTSPM